MSDVVRCRDCEFWTRKDSLEGSTFGSCLNEKFVQDYRYRDEQSTLSRDAVVVENAEGWGFQTGPDFGCVHAERRVAV